MRVDSSRGSGLRGLYCAFFLVAACCPLLGLGQPFDIRNSAGLQMTVDPNDHDPALVITVPDGPPNERTFKILIPEHVTVRAHGQVDARHLYIYDQDPASRTPKWSRIGNALEYAADFDKIRFAARATLLEDGILFRYEFTNSGGQDFDMATAITDPRFNAVFFDPRLERTYVHQHDGFKLLAARTPERLTMPLGTWFPVRYLASYTVPIPSELVQRRDGGITYRYSPDRVDAPIIATLSKDQSWVAASFSRDPGNVWTNPELTCQHVDPQVPLHPGAHAEYEVKILLFKGSLQDALNKMSVQIQTMK